MSRPDDLDDEYVAQMLKKDAEANSIKHLALGSKLSYQTGRISAPKPNTRFLRNILRETTSHNADLLAKEKREARGRQRQQQNQQSNGYTRESRSDTFSQSHEDGGSRAKRRRLDEPDSREKEHSRSRGDHGRRFPQSSRRHEGRSEEYKSSRTHRYSSADSDRSWDRSPRRSQRSYRERDDSDRGHRSSRHDHNERDRLRDHRRRRSHTRSPSPTRSRSRSKTHRSKRSSRRRTRSSARSPDTNIKSLKLENGDHGHNRSPKRVKPAPDSDSDPLEAIIGPLPPPPEPTVRVRGRGAYTASGTKSNAAMDSHFASNYDASLDVQPDPDTEDDWDQALEALRDRQKWKQQGAERLRSAGFTEQEIEKWEKGGEKDESDVRWAKKGEGREWDRGKVIDEDGGVELKPDWVKQKAGSK